MSEEPSSYNAALGSQYGEGYYMRGEGSNYVNYSWRPDLTLPHAIYVSRHLGIQQGHTILDVGCSRGYFVKAMRIMGFEAFGCDISKWAIENCDPDVKPFVWNRPPISGERFDWITMKDVAEHVPMEELIGLLSNLSISAKRGMLIIVPLSAYTGARYIRDEDEQDTTHIHRWTLSDWILFLTENTKDFTVSGSYYIRGIKECCKPKSMSCGFLTLTRI